jgi:hypothetical protein
MTFSYTASVIADAMVTQAQVGLPVRGVFESRTLVAAAHSINMIFCCDVAEASAKGDYTLSADSLRNPRLPRHSHGVNSQLLHHSIGDFSTQCWP